MEEAREIARAYFERSSEKEKELAREFFKELDHDGNGKVSIQEFKSMTYSWGWDSNAYVNSLFGKMDENRDGVLDFDEVLTFYYMKKIEFRECDACDDFLLGTYFSCVMCLGKGMETCDLCCACFRGGKYIHEHSTDNFVDSHTQLKLLRSLIKKKQITPGKKPNTEEADSPMSKLETVNEAFEAFNSGLDVGNNVVSVGSGIVEEVCCIM